MAVCSHRTSYATYPDSIMSWTNEAGSPLTLSNSSGVTTKTSVSTRSLLRAMMMGMRREILSPSASMTTRMSMSLPSSAVPEAAEPKITTFSGWNSVTIRSTASSTRL